MPNHVRVITFWLGLFLLDLVIGCQSKLIIGKMLNSCVCEIGGNIYNLSKLGDPKGDPRALSFPDTTTDYFYLINICYPFNWPPQPNEKYKSNDAINISYEANVQTYSYQPRCHNASLCQRDYYDNAQFFKTVTTQRYEDNSIRCYQNKTTGHVQWVYSGVGPLFKKGGLVLTLNCGSVSKHDMVGVHDVDRRKGDPWKYVNVTHECCCKNKCYVAPTPSPTRSPKPNPKPSSKEKENLPMEILGAGGGFLILVVIVFVGKRILNDLYSRQPLIDPNRIVGQYDTFIPNPILRGRIIRYDEISNIKEIDEGAFGIVSKGIWRGSDVAIKRIKEHVLDEDTNYFIRESTWMSKLAHKHIVQFYGICTLKPNVCIITEYMKGGSVASIIHHQGKTLTWQMRVKWSIDAVRGMMYLHANKPPIIHRDLKSDNLLVDENNVVKIADFGTLKLLIPLIRRKVDRERSRTPDFDRMQDAGASDTAWAGTLRWSAPEVIAKAGSNKKIKYTTKSDVFAFAVTMWEMIYNKRPYYHLEFNYQVMDAIDKGERPDLREDCPHRIATLLQSCWHINPRERPEFKDVLGRLETLTVIEGNRPRTL